MALSMHEQQILAEMERKLAAEEPLLAFRLTSFGSPGLATVLRSRRARLVLSLLILLAIALVSLAVYALGPAHSGTGRGAHARAAAPARITQPPAPASQ